MYLASSCRARCAPPRAPRGAPARAKPRAAGLGGSIKLNDSTHGSPGCAFSSSGMQTTGAVCCGTNEAVFGRGRGWRHSELDVERVFCAHTCVLVCACVLRVYSQNRMCCRYSLARARARALLVAPGRVLSRRQARDTADRPTSWLLGESGRANITSLYKRHFSEHHTRCTAEIRFVNSILKRRGSNPHLQPPGDARAQVSQHLQRRAAGQR